MESIDTTSPSSTDLAGAGETIRRVRERLRTVIRGRDEVIDLVLVALFADGHVLLEDYPGSGKTTLARALGQSIEKDAGADGSSLDERRSDERPSDERPSDRQIVDERIAAFRRIQFTPDLLPSDITGTSVFDLEQNTFDFRPGPIFAHIVLADEINRTSPKVQAAMLEAMAEKQVTVDNQTHSLDDLFFVIATQNPIDLAGTYPLPTPQLDRFLFKIAMTHIDRESELAVLDQYPEPSLSLGRELPTVTRREVLDARAAIRRAVTLDRAFKDALVDFAGRLRKDDRVLQGASTRSLVLSLPALQARAVVSGRDFVSPDDLETLVPYVFRHRVETVAGDESVDSVIGDALAPELEALAKKSMRRVG
ncbi:MAG: AAA family ATPase [Myxococcota bacterium]